MVRTVHVCAAVIRRDGATMLCNRPPDKAHAGLWEFPGGKRHNGESDAECLRREIHEELGACIDVLDSILHVEHEYPDKAVSLRFYRATISQGSPEVHPKEGQSVRWVETGELSCMDLLPADLPLAAFLEAGLNQNASFQRRSAAACNKSAPDGVDI
jgi:8-oxo-dGTP diphosphatase